MPLGNPRRLLPLIGIALCLLAAAVLVPDAPAAPTPTVAPPGDGPSATDAPPAGRLRGRTLADLRRAIGASEGERRGAIQLILSATAQDAETLHLYLHRTTGIPASDYKAVLRSIGAQVPDRQGHFGKSDAESSVDWLAALLAVEGGTLRKRLHSARQEALLTVALMRALAATHHPDAAVSLVRFAFRHAGAFKDECGRQIRAMSTYAVPGLLRARALKDPLAYKITRYAAYQLDRLDCARPDRALKQTDQELQAETLHAYGEVRDPSAVSTVLAYTDDPSDRVRRAARWAMLRYVSGRPPRVIKRKLKLPGGRETEARALFLTYRQLAFHALAQRLAEELLRDSTRGRAEPPRLEVLKRELTEENEPRHLAERLFTHFDEKRQEALRKDFQQALALSKKGGGESAMARYEQLLAQDPYHPQREAMAPFYYERGKQLLERGQFSEASLMFTKALHLAPAAPFVADAKGRRALAIVLGEKSVTSEEAWQLRAAVALSPQLERAKQLLRDYQRRQQLRLWVAGGVGVVAASLLLVGLALLRRRLAWL